MTKKVSLYIPCYNAEKTVAMCIEAALSQTYPVSEVILVDDGSADGTIRKVSSYNVKVIRHKENKGIAEARNTGILESTGEYTASIDSDCLPEKDWLERLMDALYRENAYGAGGRLIETQAHTYAGRWRMRHLSQNWGAETVVNPPYLSGSNTVFRKDVLIKAGLYNTRFRSNYEDYDISGRIKSAGYRLVYCPYAEVRHTKSNTTISVMDAYSRYYYFGWKKKTRPLDIIKGVLVNIFFSLKFAAEDIRDMKPALLPLDIFSLIYSLFTNMRRHITMQD